MKARYIIMAITAAAVLSSCNKMLDIPQHGVQNYDTYYQTDEEAESAVIACYIQQKGLSMNFRLIKDCLSDDIWAGGGQRNDNAELEKFNEFNFDTENTYLQGFFQGYYQLIYKANVVLGHVGEDSDIKLRARAEAKVFRAWAYFELISMWGNPPLVDHELEPSEYQQPNGTTEALWALVEKDLTEAISSGLLTEKSSVDDKTWRVTKQYAQAILGKAYLWQEKYEEAANTFDEIVKSGHYKLYDDYVNVMSFHAKQNCESMFESIKISDPNNVWNNFDMTGQMYGVRQNQWEPLNEELFASGYGFAHPQESLYQDFVAIEGENGYRLTSALKTYDQMVESGSVLKNGSILYGCEGYFNWKRRITAAECPSAGYGFVDDCNTIWMRYAEVLLCAAEAHLMNNNSAKADEYMNMIRTRAQAPTKSGYTLDEIKREKRVELFTEGTRFQDLLRWGDASEALKSQGSKCPSLNSNGTVTYTEYNDASRCGFQDKHKLLPYPGAEIRLNPNIKQNLGW